MPAAKSYKKKTKRSRRGRRQRGGASASYTFGSSAVAPGAPYAQTVVAGEACQAATKFDHLANYVPPGRGGLPGYAGGGRSTRRSKSRSMKQHFTHFSKRILKSLRFFKKGTKRSKRKQRGGAPYVVDVSQTTGGPNPFVPVTKGSCEGGYVTTQQYSAPGVLQKGGVGGVDSAYYQAPNAGYSNEVPKWLSSTGTPGGGSLIQQPYAASTMNPACLQMGAGRRRRRRGSRRKCY
jgi:hypothetical protein